MRIELQQESDGRWIAEATEIPGALAYGESKEKAVANVEALVSRILAERLDTHARETLASMHKRPGMYWGASDHPFTSLVSFLSGYRMGRIAGAPDLVPEDFHRFVTEHFGHTSPHGGAGWMTFIEENTRSESEAFELFFQLREEYEKCLRGKQEPPPDTAARF